MPFVKADSSTGVLGLRPIHQFASWLAHDLLRCAFLSGTPRVFRTVRVPAGFASRLPSSLGHLNEHVIGPRPGHRLCSGRFIVGPFVEEIAQMLVLYPRREVEGSGWTLEMPHVASHASVTNVVAVEFC